MEVTYEWRGDFDNAVVNALHAEGFGHPQLEIDWTGQVQRHSLGWVCARLGLELVGFVNLAWDGGVHAFILDTLVSGRHRRRGIAKEMVGVAVARAREAGCEWVHVDFEGPDLHAFYLDACGFVPTDAGLIEL